MLPLSCGDILPSEYWTVQVRSVCCKFLWRNTHSKWLRAIRDTVIFSESPVTSSIVLLFFLSVQKIEKYCLFTSFNRRYLHGSMLFPHMSDRQEPHHEENCQQLCWPGHWQEDDGGYQGGKAPRTSHLKAQRQGPYGKPGPIRNTLVRPGAGSRQQEG